MADERPEDSNGPKQQELEEAVSGSNKVEYLDCPECGEHVLPGTWNRQKACWWWTDDMTAKCDCGAVVGVKVDDEVARSYTIEEAKP